MGATTVDSSTGPQAGVPQLTFPTIAIVNDQSSGVADADVQTWIAAIATQLRSDFGPAWATGAHLRFVGQGQKPPLGVWVIVLLDNSDQAGALGYHDLTPDGLPLGKVFAGTDRQYGQQVSVTLDHELLEMLADPYINRCAQADDGCFYALEVCDPVEADGLGYQVDGVQLSDFVTPHWFGNGAGPVDHLGHITDPFRLAAGGYISLFDPAGGHGWIQHTAETMKTAAEHAYARPRVGSRRERRFTPRYQWVRSTYQADAQN
jgi:hypothetical protein